MDEHEPRRMFEIGVEGDPFHEHFEGSLCARAGCVPATEERREQVRAFEREQAARLGIDPTKYNPVFMRDPARRDP